MPGTTNYPSALDTNVTLPQDKTDDTLTAGDHDVHHNNLAAALIAVQTALGTTPYGTYATVAAAIANKVDLSPTAEQVILGTGDIVGLTVKATALQATKNVFQMRLNNNAIGAYIDKNGNFSAQGLLIAGAALAASHLSNGVSGTGAIVLASAITGLAPLAGPTFTGVPAAPTAAVDTNTTQVATTAFVLGQATAANPVMDGAVAVGTSTRYARADHVHPTDTSRAPVNAPTFTGLVTVSASGIQFSDATVMTTATTGPTYGTSFPGSPTNGQEHVLVDSTTAPTYQWRFRYNSSSTSPYKWEFVGGAKKVVGASSTSLPAHAGDYVVEGKMSVGNGGTSTGGDLEYHLQIGGVTVDSCKTNAPSSAGSGTSARGWSHFNFMARATAASGATLSIDGGDAYFELSYIPVRLS